LMKKKKPDGRGQAFGILIRGKSNMNARANLAHELPVQQGKIKLPIKNFFLCSLKCLNNGVDMCHINIDKHINRLTILGVIKTVFFMDNNKSPFVSSVNIYCILFTNKSHVFSLNYFLKQESIFLQYSIQAPYKELKSHA
ncbi:hypothetical protein VH96_14260, partial [Acinetobacter indicus]